MEMSCSAPWNRPGSGHTGDPCSHQGMLCAVHMLQQSATTPAPSSDRKLAWASKGPGTHTLQPASVERGALIG